MLVNNNDYFLVQDQVTGLFLKTDKNLRDPDVKYFWVTQFEATPFFNLFSTRNILEKHGLCKGDYIWVTCNEDGELV